MSQNPSSKNSLFTKSSLKIRVYKIRVHNDRIMSQNQSSHNQISQNHVTKSEYKKFFVHKIISQNQSSQFHQISQFHQRLRVSSSCNSYSVIQSNNHKFITKIKITWNSIAFSQSSKAP
ncbi:hypothetical protein AAHE18_05G225700 [Arachis hypogaea]